MLSDNKIQMKILDLLEFVLILTEAMQLECYAIATCISTELFVIDLLNSFQTQISIQY